MISRVLKLFKREYHTLNKIELSKNNLLNNYKYLLSLNPKIKIAPVLKSNAYGHGIIQVAGILDPLGSPFFCVDSLYEAYKFLKASIKTPILIMGYTNPANLKIKKLPFFFTVFDLETARVLNQYQPECQVHIFVDTGMHREGIQIDDLPQFLNRLKKLSHIKVSGLMSHLAIAEKPNDPLTKKQIDKFVQMHKIVKKFGFSPKWIHLANSAGFLNNLNPGTNLARTGLALYGIDPTGNHPRLNPVLTFTTKIVQIKNLEKEDKVGYDHTFTAKKDMIIGILPLGYFDGVDRRLSNRGFVKVDDKDCPIIGRVSMNLTSIDLSTVQNPQIGDEVLVYSSNRTDVNSIENSAKICQTISYDLLVNLAQSTKRVVI